MTDNVRIREGDLVMVAFPAGEKTENPAHKYDGEQFVVKRKYKAKSKKGGDTYQYELYGATSKKGLPYVFLTDELIRL